MENTNAPSGASIRERVANSGPIFRHVHDGHRANGFVESVRSKRQEDLGIGSVNNVVFDRRIAGRALASTCDEFGAVVEGDHMRPEFRHPPGESPGAASGVENRVPSNDTQEAFRGRLDQHPLEIVAITDPVMSRNSNTLKSD